MFFLLECGAAQSRAQTTPNAPAAQSASPGADSTAGIPTVQTVQTTTNPPPKAPVTQKTGHALNEHNFWDKENDWLFAGVAAARTLDYFSTLKLCAAAVARRFYSPTRLWMTIRPFAVILGGRVRERLLGCPTCFITTGTTNWNAGLLWCISVWLQPGRFEITR